MTPVDIAVLTAKVEEFDAFTRRLADRRPFQGTREAPNQYAWTLGSIEAANGSGPYKVVVGLTHEQTNVPAALAALETYDQFRPRYIVFMGIAGSLDPDLRQGDVFCADYVRSFEYGVINEKGQFDPRAEFQEATDATLRRSAVVFGLGQDWKTIAGARLGTLDDYPVLKFGGLASGDKVIEGVNNAFFAPVRAADDWLRAVDMESAGVAQAVRKLNETGHAIGFMVVRGISDAPGGPQANEPQSEGANRQSRREWTAYACGAAAAFLEQFIKHAFPFAPTGVHQIDPSALDDESPYQSALVSAAEVPTIHALNDEIFRPSDLVPKATLETWWRANPLTIGLVTTEGEPVGYWHILMLTPPAFEALLMGDLVEKQIDGTHLLQYQQLKPGEVLVYITAVAARAAHKTGSAAALLDLFAFLGLLQKEIGIDAIAAQTVSKDPIGIVTKFRMTSVAGGHAPLPTWVLRPKTEVALALKKADQKVQRMGDRVPVFSADDKQTVIDLLQR